MMLDDLLLAGVDEVGRGPLAGPVIAAAVILDPQHPIVGLADSKKLTEKRRQSLSEQIRDQALAWALGRAEVEEIDNINILQASLLAMQRAVEALPLKARRVLVDGNRCPVLAEGVEVQAIVKGDSTVPAISAASIIAKVARDKEMCTWALQYPDYGFEGHKGYPTQKHLHALHTLGVTPLHRRSFAPVRACLK